jgi:hypothetical protein
VLIDEFNSLLFGELGLDNIPPRFAFVSASLGIDFGVFHSS